MRLLEYENKGSLKLEYKPGLKHQAPDALSCCLVDDAPVDMEAEFTSWLCSAMLVFSCEPTIPTDPNNLLELQNSDYKAAAMIKWLKEKELPRNDPGLRSWLLSVADSCAISNEGLLYRLLDDHNSGEVHQRLFVPETLRESLLHEAHSNPIAGHSGVEKMLHRLEEKYYWPAMRADIVKFYHTCVVCASRQGQGRLGTAPLKPIEPPKEPLDCVSMDILGLSQTRSRNRYILVMVDSLMKFCWAEPMPDQEAQTVANAFLKMSTFGLLKNCLTDQGVQFHSKLHQALCEKLGVKQLMTSAFWPQGDGQTEHMNQTIIGKLAKVVGPNCDDWDEILPLTLLGYNTENTL